MLTRRVFLLVLLIMLSAGWVARRRLAAPRAQAPAAGLRLACRSSICRGATSARPPSAGASTMSRRSRATRRSSSLATASGGIFKSVNNGVTWKPVFDQDGIGAIDRRLAHRAVAIRIHLGRDRRAEQPPELVVG